MTVEFDIPKSGSFNTKSEKPLNNTANEPNRRNSVSFVKSNRRNSVSFKECQENNLVKTYDD